MLDLAAEEGLVVGVWVERPGEQGAHLHRAVAARAVAVPQEVDGLGAVHPVGELAAHHRLGDVLSGRPDDAAGVRGQAAGGALRGGTPAPVLSVQQGQRPLQLGVVQVAVQEAAEGPAVLQGTRAGRRRLRHGHCIDGLPVSLEIDLK